MPVSHLTSQEKALPQHNLIKIEAPPWSSPQWKIPPFSGLGFLGVGVVTYISGKNHQKGPNETWGISRVLQNGWTAYHQNAMQHSRLDWFGRTNSRTKNESCFPGEEQLTGRTWFGSEDSPLDNRLVAWDRTWCGYMVQHSTRRILWPGLYVSF